MNRLITSILALTLTLVSFAQDIIVTMTPTQQILPPQVLLYLSQPNQYFNVSLMNTTSEPKQVYLGMNIEQILPSPSISIRVGARQQPERPFVVPANGTYNLTMVDMKKMFDHVPSSEIQATPGLFDNYEYGAFGLLPEGEYEAQIVAYQWNPSLRNPVAVSNPSGSKCSFTICYKAQAPQFLMPMVANAFDLNQVAEVDPATPQFTWTAPVIACNPLASNFQYSLKIVELLPTQTPTEAMERNPAVYISPSLLISPLCILPQTIAKRLDPKLTYVAQVTASTTSLLGSYLNYAMIENDGKSTYRLFKVKAPKAEEKAPEEEKAEEKAEEKKAEEKAAEPEKAKDAEENELELSLTAKNKWQVDSTKLYTFRNPEIMAPRFAKDEKRRTKVFQDIHVKWNAAWYVGGLGLKPDTLKMKYKINLYSAEQLIEDYNEIEEYCKTNKPVLMRETEEITDTIQYSEISDYVKAGDYLYLRIDPICINEDSIAFVDSVCNRANWALIDPPTKKYFQCSNTVVIDDNLPTDKKAADLKGQVVSIGEYKLTLDEIDDLKGNKGCFKGKGHIEWRPLGAKVMVAVKFDSIAINKDGIVYDGEVKTYPRPEMTNSQVVDEIFSDLGIDDWASDLGLPYGSAIDKISMETTKKVADKVDISEYYKYVKTGKGIWDDITSGEIKDLYLPLQVPKDINKSPVDIQIHSATFAPQWAKMNIIGEFTLPESEYLKDNILILAAPRLCISPERLIPESGTLALMKDFTIVDPKSQFEFTFNAPDDLEEPTKGCFVSWHADEFELLDIDVSMLIPNLKKVDAKGNKTDEMPELNFQTSIGGWDDWFGKGTMDPFMSEDLEGWIFQPGTIGYDHSTQRSVTGFKGLPDDYDRVKAGMGSAASDDTKWQGLFIQDMGIVFPKMLNVTDTLNSWEGHLKVMAKNILIDDSGFSLKLAMENVLKLETCKAGGWSLSVDEVGLDITQNTFKKCGFSGKFQTPLEGMVGYKCDIIAQGKKEGRAEGEEGFAYVFSTQQIDGLKFDFWLAELDFDRDQTYFLLEAETYNNDREDDVRVELCMGGTLSVTIARNTKVGAYLNAALPDIHITGMRLANCPRWKSKFFDNFADINDIKAKEGSISLNKLAGMKEEYNCGNAEEKGNFYFSLGRWSLASMEKSIGQFKFGLKDYGFKLNGKKAELSFTGMIGICDVLEASCGLAIVANIDVNKFSFSFDKVAFKKAELSTGFGGLVKVKGSLEVVNEENQEGYKGTLGITLAGDIFDLNANGGFYTCTDQDEQGNDIKYSWGYLTAELKSKAGIRIDPIVINGVSGGFYFNCKPTTSSDKTPTRKKGEIGFMLGMKICTSAGEKSLSADMDLTVVFDTQIPRLSAFIMNGTLKALDGVVEAQAQILYTDDDESRIFNLNLTANGGQKLDNILSAKFANFAGKSLDYVESIQQGLSDLSGIENDEKEKPSKEEFTATNGLMYLLICAFSHSRQASSPERPSGTCT